ncbi:oxidoreductase [Pseudobutyrivibrio sp.]|uniref:oxidoreductase n=1 Tax=Pseudobutyrivibrio sp. TaxID=2014367 RepID=UPI001D9EE2F2|nr:FAD-dependent oxidoreductase [Pseudobutyrivibrio sp.]MBE5911203.1 FAD-dependent oxidoreductase [Pseudobutyrivibrio sp.]
MSYEHVMSPIQIGPMYLKNRVSFTPVWPSFATADGHVNRELMEWVRDIVKGGVACINIGCGCVNRNLPPYVTHLLRMSDESVVNEMTMLSDLCHMYQCKIGMELFAINIDGGSFEDRETGKDKVVVELDPSYMTKEQIKDYIEDFALAAERAMRCGVDSLVIHGAHGQLPGCFLNKVINERTDEYSADTIENASRFTVELLTAIREKVGNKLAIEYRINANDMVPGSPSVDEVIEFAKMIEDKIDLLHVSRGLHSVQHLAPYINQPLYIPHGINIEDAAKFKKALNIPVTVVGSVTLDQAEEYIKNGDADMVSMARGLMADPNLVKNAKNGCADKTRPCIRCNQCIQRTHYLLAPVRCSVNAEMGMETLYMNIGTTTPKKVAVIGGGPGGIEAARTAAERGHSVDLYEKSDILGGVLNMAAGPDFKADIKNYLEWTIRSIKEQKNVNIHMNTEVTPEMLAGKGYDVVIVAIGSEPIIPGFVKSNSKVVWVGDVECHRVEVGQNVVIVGAGLTGCESALALANEGKNVTLIDMIPADDFGRGGAKFNQIALMNQLNEKNITKIGEVKLASEGDTVSFEKLDGTKLDIECDNIILSLGVRPNQDKVNAFNSLDADVVFIGDCNTRVGTLFNAVHTAHEAASII